MEGNGHDDLLQDDASIESVSESGDSHTRGSEWSVYSPGTCNIAGSDISMMDFQKLSIHSKMATIVHKDGRQFIKRRDSDDGGLPYSAEFYLNGEVWKLNGEDCVLMSLRRYIAMVNVEGTINFDGTDGFEEGVRTLLKHLKVEKVCLDKDLEECNKAKSVLGMTLDKLTDESGENISRRRNVMLLHMLLRKHGNALSMDFKHDLRNCSRLSSEMMSTLDNYVAKSLKLIQRNEFLGNLNDFSLSDEFFNEAIQVALNQHRARLVAICPSSMNDKLKELPDDRILCVSMDDIQLFKDLTTLDETVLPMIFSKFLTRVQEINVEQFADLNPLSNRIFLYVCKSLQEVAEQLSAHTKTDNAIIYSESLAWVVTNLQEESYTSYSKCLRQQLQMLAKLANHFEPGGPFRTSRFPYEFKVFQNMDAIPEQVRIWLCLLDDCLKDLVQADLDKMQMLSCFFKSYVSFIASEDFRSETLECLRTITHDALRSLADMASSQQNQTTSDPASVEYNQMISCCLDKFPREHFGNECDQIEASLQQIICKTMTKNVSSDELSKFSNVFKQLLNDLSDLQLEWFIRLTPSDKRNFLLRKHFIVPVDNIWKDTEDACFKVVDLEGFIEMYKLLYNSEEMPKHYQIKVIQVLLQNVEKLASKKNGNEGKPLSDKDMLDAMNTVINSIRSSLVILKEQPDYCQFEEFLLKMSEPRVEGTKEEKQELPYTDFIDSDETLDPLLDRFESSISKVFLRNGLKVYTTQFNKHIAETVRLSRDKKIEKIVSDVKSKIDPQIVASWTEEFKRNELPEVLAGLSAVWSIIVSENDSSSKTMTKPSYLQICCVLSIFGDQHHTKDYSHQFLQLSTPEGKEFVLGLTAALLALHGHKIEIACFNSLIRINSLDSIEVFKSFSILSNISYESLQDIAWKKSKGVYEKYMTYINKCFGFETNANNDNEPKNASEDERSVLLIEDIDIILQENIIHRCFKWFIRMKIPGLEEVHRKLFCQNEPLNRYEIDEYINQSGNPNIKLLREFLDRPHSYKILQGNPIKAVECTNYSVFLNNINKATKTEFGSDFPQAVSGCIKYGYLSLGHIFLPYKYLLKCFPLVLGFTIAPVAKSDEIVLNNLYGIYHKILESDVFQTIPNNFDSKKDFLYIDSKDEWDWISAIIGAIQAAIDRNCLVLVAFKGAQEMDLLQQTEFLKQLNTTAIKTASSRENLSDYEDSYDEISVLMVCNGHFAKERQVHVIQTFFSDCGKEEALIRRLGEQRHSSGSYELIVPRIPRTTNPREEEITYDWLVKKREYSTVEKFIYRLFLNEQCERIKMFFEAMIMK